MGKSLHSESTCTSLISFKAIILVIGLLFLPETPRYLIKCGNHPKAAQSLAKLRRLPHDDPYIIEELAEIQANHDYELRLGKSSSYLDCFRGGMAKRLATGCLLQALQQLTGVNFIFCKCNSANKIMYGTLLITTHRLRYSILQELWNQQCLCHSDDYQCRQRFIYSSRFIRH